MNTLELPRALVNQILAHAQQSPDEEICGLISSKNGAANRYYQITNVADSKANRFEMSGAEQIAAMKNMRSQDEELLAIVHSHPNAPAIPSETDKKENQYADIFYLVVSLDTKGVIQLQAYRQQGGEFKTTELILEQPAPTS